MGKNKGGRKRKSNNSRKNQKMGHWNAVDDGRGESLGREKKDKQKNLSWEVSWEKF